MCASRCPSSSRRPGRPGCLRIRPRAPSGGRMPDRSSLLLPLQFDDRVKDLAVQVVHASSDRIDLATGPLAAVVDPLVHGGDVALGDLLALELLQATLVVIGGI